METKSLQEEFALKSICYGCGPANAKGLRIRSLAENDNVVCTWTPESHHEAFPNVLNGGIIGTLLDCHCNWTAAWELKKKFQLNDIPCTVTAEYKIKLLRPTPSNSALHLSAHAVEVIDHDRVWVEGELSSGGKIMATCRGLFVAVKENHPAFHRW